MVGDLPLADQVLGAGELIGKDAGDEILGVHAKQLGRHLLARAEARQRERNPGYPTPARDEHRRVEQGLDEDAAYAGRMYVTGDLGQFEAVRGGKRQYDVVLGRRRLQLEIELAAEALAQRQAPGTVDAAAVGAMDDELHAAGFVEEPLDDQAVLRRHVAKCGPPAAQILDQLAGGRLADADLPLEPTPRAFAAARTEDGG